MTYPNRFRALAEKKCGSQTKQGIIQPHCTLGGCDIPDCGPNPYF